MKITLEENDYILEQFNGDFSTGIITKINGFGFTPNAPGICSCGRGIQEHILFKEEAILCPGDFVLFEIKEKKFKFLKQDFLKIGLKNEK